MSCTNRPIAADKGMTTLQKSATEQLNKLIEFRQIVYGEVLTTARDGLFEAIDSLLLSDHPLPLRIPRPHGHV